MAATLKSLDQVLGLKRRRIDKLEAQAAEQSRQVKACEEQLAQAQERQRQAEEAEQQVKDAIVRLMSQPKGFKPAEFVTLHHVLDMKVAETKMVIKHVQQAESQLAAAREALRQTRRQIEKAENQLEELKKLRDQLARELEQAVEDATDEESEEASVARMISGAIEARALEAQEWN